MSLYLKDRHLAVLGIALLAVIAGRLILADTGTTPLNPGHPLSQTWIDTNLNLGSYNLYTLGNVGIGTTSPGAKLDIAGNIRTSSTILIPQSSAPASPVAGEMYYDSSAKKIKYFDGSYWKYVSTGSPGWIGDICPGIEVYYTNLPSTYSWGPTDVSCGSPQCVGNNLVADNSVDFSSYPARNACKISVDGRLPTGGEL